MKLLSFASHKCYRFVHFGFLIIICAIIMVNISPESENHHYSSPIIKKHVKIAQDHTLDSLEIDALASGLGAHNWSWAVSQPWCTGFGTYQQPFIINSIYIDAFDKGYGISIKNSKAHFILQNCLIEDGEYYDEAILFENVSNAIIQNNEIIDNERAFIASSTCQNNTLFNNTISGQALSSSDLGISFSSNCFNNTIIENQINFVDHAIQLSSSVLNSTIINNTIESLSDHAINIISSSHFTTIIDNIISVGEGCGIYISGSDYSEIHDNEISFMNRHGIHLYNGADYNNLTNNNLANNAIFGILISDSSSNYLSQNTLTANSLGLYAGSPIISEYLHYIDPSNTLNGLPIYYYRDVSNLTSANFTNAAQIYVVNCSNVEIRGYTFIDHDYGVFLAQSNNITVKENHFEGHYYDGIYAFNLTQANITQNNLTLNLRRGIFFDRYCSYNHIFHNNITQTGDTSGNDHGVYIYYYSSHNVIRANQIITSADSGLYVDNNCYNITFQQNNVQDCGSYGVYIYSSCNAFKLLENNVSDAYSGVFFSHYCNDLVINNNNISANNRHGLYLSYNCDNINVTSNYIGDNGQVGEYYGLYAISNCERVRVQYNTFVNNDRYGLFLSSLSGVQVFDNHFEGTGFGISGSNDDHFYHDFNLNNSYGSEIIYYYWQESNLQPENFTDAAQIYLINCKNVLIEDVTIFNEQYGLFLYNTSYTTLINGTFTYNELYSIYFFKSSHNQVLESNCSYVEDYNLIYLDTNCVNNTFAYNELFYTQSLYQNGIYLDSNCNNNSFIHNSIIQAGTFGIYLISASNFNNFSFNQIIGVRRYEGIYISGCDGNIFEHTLVDDSGRYGMYITNSDDTLILNCSITNNDGAYSIYIYNNCLRTIIRETEISNNYGHGIYVRQTCQETQIFKCNITRNGQTSSYGYGIYIHSLCDFVNISYNSITHNRKTGIWFNVECEDGYILYNNITDNQEHGIFTQDQCRSVRIWNNQILRNSMHGIYLLDDCDDYRIEKNTIINNTDHGILIDEYCNANILYNNTLRTNGIGIGLYDFNNNNHIYLNYFLNNSQHAKDDGVGFLNHWDNGTIGNYWDNYTEFDKDDDGIGDTPWLIAGSGGFYDYFPIWEDGKDLDPFPDISHPPNLEYFFGSQGHNITWIANATSPDYFRITRNGTIITEGVWFNFEPISINVDSLQVGIYIYVCMVNSTYTGTEVFDNVQVQVKRTTPLITHPKDISFNLGELGHNITWIGDAPFPETVILMQDGLVIREQSWNHLIPISLGLDDFDPGVYIFECILNVSSGETVSDSVTVEIVELPIEITHPANYEYVVTTTGHSLSWTGNSVIPDIVSIYRDDILVYQNPWLAGISINLSIDDLMPGSYTFLCILNSTTGLSVSDVVQVRVIEPLPQISHPQDLIYVYGTPDLSITWEISALLPHWVSIFQSDTLIEQFLWEDLQEVTIPVEGLVLGAHTFECVINTTTGLSVGDSVVVTVIEPQPVISHLTDLTLNATNSNQTLTWVGISPFAENVSIYRNGDLIYEGTWINGQSIPISLNNLTNGQYIFECVFTTSTGYTYSDSVIVVVDDGTSNYAQQLKEAEETYDRRKRIFWIIIIIMGVLLAGSVGVISYYIRKQKDYATYMDLLKATDHKRYEKARNEKYMTLADHAVDDDTTRIIKQAKNETGSSEVVTPPLSTHPIVAAFTGFTKKFKHAFSRLQNKIRKPSTLTDEELLAKKEMIDKFEHHEQIDKESKVVFQVRPTPQQKARENVQKKVLLDESDQIIQEDREKTRKLTKPLTKSIEEPAKSSSKETSPSDTSASDSKSENS